MASRTTKTGDDDSTFLHLIDGTFSGILHHRKPREAWIIKVDNWFDKKWLNFSGIGIVHFPNWGILAPEAALDEFSQDHVTFPPFTPNRVLEQSYFARTPDGDYVRQNARRTVHQGLRQSSAANLQRRVSDFSDSAVFAWYSSNTLASGRGTLMVYCVSESVVETWFAAFKRAPDWRLELVAGISRDEVQDLMNWSTRNPSSFSYLSHEST